MKLLDAIRERLLGGESIVLMYEHFDPALLELFEEQIKEIGTYFRFVKFSEIVGCLEKKRVEASAAIVFRNARKSVYWHAVPYLAANEIPFSVALRSDCIGSNRLPPDETIQIYREKYSDANSVASHSDSRGAVEMYRSKFGPLPYDQLDPMKFFSTWGKVNGINPALWEGILYLHESIVGVDDLKKELDFVSTQIRQPVQAVFYPSSTNVSVEMLKRAMVRGALTEKLGKVNRLTNPWAIPYWKLEESHHEEKKQPEQKENPR